MAFSDPIGCQVSWRVASFWFTSQMRAEGLRSRTSQSPESMAQELSHQSGGSWSMRLGSPACQSKREAVLNSPSVHFCSKR